MTSTRRSPCVFAFLLPRAVSERHYDLVFKLLMIACWIVAIAVVARVLAGLRGVRRGA